MATIGSTLHSARRNLRTFCKLTGWLHEHRALRPCNPVDTKKTSRLGHSESNATGAESIRRTHGGAANASEYLGDVQNEQSTGTISANGLEFPYLAQGEGTLVLLFHGYPETPHCFDAVLPRLAEAGYRAVAPWMRGYAPSTIPPDGDYSLRALGGDVLSLIEAFGAERATVIGHDWGAYAGYAAANLCPERIAKLVTIAIPHPHMFRRTTLTPRRLFGARHFIGYRLPGAAARVRRRDFAHLATLQRRWSPGWTSLDPKELGDVKRVFRQPGCLDAALGYYRQFRLTGPPAPLRDKTSVSTLCFAGVADSATALSMFDDAAGAFTGPYELVQVPGAGHFLHREEPELFCRKLLEFLADRQELGA